MEIQLDVVKGVKSAAGLGHGLPCRQERAGTSVASKAGGGQRASTHVQGPCLLLTGDRERGVEVAVLLVSSPAVASRGSALGNTGADLHPAHRLVCCLCSCPACSRTVRHVQQDIS